MRKRDNYDEFLCRCRLFGKGYADLGEDKLETRMFSFGDCCRRHRK